jgi:hypothetical protein
MHELTGSFRGKEMLMHQIHRCGRKGWPILHRSGDPFGEAGLTQLMAGGTQLAFTLMLNDVDPLGRKVDHLATLKQEGGIVAQILLAVLALGHLMKHDFIGIFLHAEGVALVTSLPSRFLSTALAQALRLS